jgi:hypothetical protein
LVWVGGAKNGFFGNPQSGELFPTRPSLAWGRVVQVEGGGDESNLLYAICINVRVCVSMCGTIIFPFGVRDRGELLYGVSGLSTCKYIHHRTLHYIILHCIAYGVPPSSVYLLTDSCSCVYWFFLGRGS